MPASAPSRSERYTQGFWPLAALPLIMMGLGIMVVLKPGGTMGLVTNEPAADVGVRVA